MRKASLHLRFLAIVLLSILAVPAVGGAARDGTVTFLADLPAELAARIAVAGPDPTVSGDAPAELREVFEAGTPYRFHAAGITAHTDSRWFATASVAGPSAPLLELRRWPGDTILALYAIRNEGDVADPPVPDGSFLPTEPLRPEALSWKGSVTTEAGGRPAIWIEEEVVKGGPRIGMLLLPGDAGFGAAGVASLTAELLAVAARVAVKAEIFAKQAGVPTSETTVRLPAIRESPGDGIEADDSWQVSRGTGFTLGLPPGFRAHRMDGSVPPPRSVPGGLLWIRGRFLDSKGQSVVVGDGTRFGYVSEVVPPPENWTGTEGGGPAGIQGAKRLAHEPFAIAAEHTGASASSAARWSEPDFSGQWLVFRLAWPDRGVEIALPVLSGRQSESLFWIPMTWRPDDRAPAPPPVDPAERFDIRFDRLRPSQRIAEPWIEGRMVAPGIRIDVPSGWTPSVALRSKQGYPVHFVDNQGVVRCELMRLDAADTAERLRDETGWNEEEGSNRRGAKEIHSTGAGSYLFVAREGHSFLFTLEKLPDGEATGEWKRMLESVRLIRSGKVNPDRTRPG